MNTFGFIGAGNMGSALARAIGRSNPSALYVSDATADKAEALARELGGGATDNETLSRNAYYIFLGVKPQVMPRVLASLAPSLRAREDRFVLVSMAAGLSCKSLEAMVGFSCPIVRLMPNTPAAIGKGMILVCDNGKVSEDERREVRYALSFAGQVDPIDESLIDAASALSGCGPAFVYLFIEAMADGAVSCGLPRDKALTYAAQTLIGAAEMVKQTGQHPGALKDAVCSPAGSTIEGVRALEEGAFRSDVIKSIAAAYRKTRELAGQ